jgi:hypothetical protein
LPATRHCLIPADNYVLPHHYIKKAIALKVKPLFLDRQQVYVVGKTRLPVPHRADNAKYQAAACSSLGPVYSSKL